VVAISYDSPEILQRFAEERNISFLLLADPGSKTIDAYGLRNSEAPKRWDGIPHPGTLIIDRQGVIRAKLFHEGYQKRHGSGEIIEAIRALKLPAAGSAASAVN
jgi:peroxiredoxin